MIGTACTLRPEKALDVLIRAAAALLDDFADLRVLIAGDGPDRARVEALIAELGLGEVVTPARGAAATSPTSCGRSTSRSAPRTGREARSR